MLILFVDEIARVVITERFQPNQRWRIYHLPSKPKYVVFHHVFFKKVKEPPKTPVSLTPSYIFRCAPRGHEAICERSGKGLKRALLKSVISARKNARNDDI
jgi:hypothetical protein